jgi:CO/xanthine dehydrogenase Mo-binding subunit
MSIGKSINREDAVNKVLGKPEFCSDLDKDNQLYMKVCFAGVSHAAIRSIDISRAENLNGVVIIITANDIPGNNEYGFTNMDQPVLCGPGSKKEGVDRVRFPYDHVALVIAESEEIAEKARDLINIDYITLPAVYDPREAMKNNSVSVHPEISDSNVFNHAHIHRGEVEEAFEDADIIVEGDYFAPAQEHAYLEPDNGVAWVEDGVVTVVSTGQWAHHDRKQIAHVLGIPESRVRVIYKMIGGAFGGREDVALQIVLGLASFKLTELGINRPVRCTWTREEVTNAHCKRHPYHMRSKWGAKSDGTIIAAKVEMIADAGAYIYTSMLVSGNAVLSATGPYEVPNICIDVYDVYTNKVPKGAFRGFGGPQTAFQYEMQIEKLAKALDMDPVELRMKNLYKEGSIQPTGSPIPPGVSIRETLADCAAIAGWSEEKGRWKKNVNSLEKSINPDIRRGWGISSTLKNIGFAYGFQEFCGCKVELFGKDIIEHVLVKHGAPEMGQGSHNVIRQMAAYALSLPEDKIELLASDTDTSSDAGSCSASRMTFVAGNSVQEACELALEKWFEGDRPAVIDHMWKGRKTTPRDPVTGACDPNLSYGYTAVYTEVEVNIKTGEVIILKLICSNDVGKAINPQQVEGQIEGTIAQALGYTLMENFIEEKGHIKTTGFSTYLIPLAPDMPENVDIRILEFADPRGPWGARGVGEMPFCTVPSAVVSAVNRALSTEFNILPINPENIYRGLKSNGNLYSFGNSN